MSDKGAVPPAAAVALAIAVTDLEIQSALESILRDSNAFSSLSGVLKQLESMLGVDLSHKLSFIRAQIHHFLFLQSQGHNFVPILYQHQKDHYPLPLPPNLDFHPAPSPSLPPDFTTHQPSEDHNNRPPQQLFESQSRQPPSPQPTSVKCDKVSSSGITARATPKESAPTVKRRRGGPGGLNKLCGVSPELQAIVGQPTLSRTDIVKQLWDYIRRNNLQDPNNKRKILCNDELRLVLETDCTDMFKMNKLLAKHIIPLEPIKQIDRIYKKPKVDEESVSQCDDPVPIVIISESLADFFGCEEREMSQAEVLRQMWEYIKVNQLEDPLNSISIRCDAKLQGILGCENVSALGIPDMLAERHLSRKS